MNTAFLKAGSGLEAGSGHSGSSLRLVRVPLVRHAPVTISETGIAGLPVGLIGGLPGISSPAPSSSPAAGPNPDPEADPRGSGLGSIAVQIGVTDRHRYLLQCPVPGWDELFWHVERRYQEEALKLIRKSVR